LTPDNGAARQLLAATLQQWGGETVWAKVNTAEVQGSLKQQNSPNSKQLDWFDNLAAGSQLSRRTFTDSQGLVTTTNQGASDLRTVTLGNKSYQIPPPDYADRVLRNLPALSLLNILKSKDYHLATLASADASRICVLVRSRLPYFSQMWSFSAADKTLISVSYQPYNVIAPRVQVWATVRYLETKSQNGLVIPTHVIVEGAGASVSDYKFTTQTFNQPDQAASTTSAGASQ
jgi:hypothetical protein